MKPTNVNTKLLLKVKQAILNEPRAFDMDMWDNQDEIAPCGTTACIAGWASVIHFHFKNPGTARKNEIIFSNGTDYLNLNEQQEIHLCYVGGWPKPFQEAYKKAKTREAGAQVAADRIDHFLATGE